MRTIEPVLVEEPKGSFTTLYARRPVDLYLEAPAGAKFVAFATRDSGGYVVWLMFDRTPKSWIGDRASYQLTLVASGCEFPNTLQYLGSCMKTGFMTDQLHLLCKPGVMEKA
jgi:hypothetical protein